MSDQFLIVKARNTLTGATVKQQDLTGARFTLAQRAFAQELAVRLAETMTARTGEPWQALVEAYTPSVRNSG
jgi:hypothetical protein